MVSMFSDGEDWREMMMMMMIYWCFGDDDDDELMLRVWWWWWYGARDSVELKDGDVTREPYYN